MRRRSSCFLAVVMVWACWMIVWEGVSIAAEAAAAIPSREQGTVAKYDDTYIVGKGDVLEINVWREPILSGEKVVRSDGMISFTLLGDIRAAGRTPMDLKQEIQRGLREFVDEAAVTVIVKNPTSQKFYVIGEVRTPGEYDLIKDLTVIQAIALAGGFGEWASKDKILLLRQENGIEKRIQINYKNIIKGKDGAKNITLRANDTIVVP